MSTLIIYSQNVNCDKHSDKLIENEEMKEWKFENRIKIICKKIPDNVDIVAINEVRFQERVDLVKKLMKKKGFYVQEFANNNSEMSFHNFLCLRKDSQWECKSMIWETKWLAKEGEIFYLSDKLTTIDGDLHGRCVGIVYLTHKKDDTIKVCVAVSHVVPFGDVKFDQQKALFTLNRTNLRKRIPTIIVGDVNRFPEEEEQFNKSLEDYNLLEVKPNRLVIPYEKEKDIDKKFDYITSEEDIGTFTPWPIEEKIYNEKKPTPLRKSRLDAHVYTDDPELVEVCEAEVRAVMFYPISRPQTPPPQGFNKIRYILDRKMASDHMPIITTYKIK